MGVPCPWVGEGDSEVQGIMGNGHMGPTPTTKTDTYETLHCRIKNARFPVGGGTDPPGAPTYNFPNFSYTLLEIENILSRVGREVCALGEHRLDPPLKYHRKSILYLSLMFPCLPKQNKKGSCGSATEYRR